MVKKSYLECQLYKFAKINGIERRFKNHYYFGGIGVQILFSSPNYAKVSSIPFQLVGFNCELYFTSIPELIFKLLKHGYIPLSLSDLKFKPFNYTQLQLTLFTEYEHKIIELRKNNLIKVIEGTPENYTRISKNIFAYK